MRIPRYTYDPIVARVRAGQETQRLLYLHVETEEKMKSPEEEVEVWEETMNHKCGR